MNDFTRQMDLLDPYKYQPRIVVLGAGTIGSWTVFCLAKMGLRHITVIDHDKIELHNSPNQLYFPHHSGRLKIDALDKLISQATGIEILPWCAKIIEEGKFHVLDEGEEKTVLSTLDEESPNYIISAVDSLLVRKWIAMYAMRCNTLKLLIDGRIGGNVYEVHAIHPSELKQYIDTMPSDDTKFENPAAQAAFDAKCTARSIADVAFLVAGRISSMLRIFETTGSLTHYHIHEDVRNQLSWK